jgi:hypothetical protein
LLVPYQLLKKYDNYFFANLQGQYFIDVIDYKKKSKLENLIYINIVRANPTDSVCGFPVGITLQNKLVNFVQQEFYRPSDQFKIGISFSNNNKDLGETFPQLFVFKMIVLTSIFERMFMLKDKKMIKPYVDQFDSDFSIFFRKDK